MAGEPESISEAEFLEQLHYLSALQASKKIASKAQFSVYESSEGVIGGSKK